ncbi:acetyl/propionyl/methylcrotonyl-CoA carboxylase subunit alpha [Inquilinus sp. CAU 1745]|uniref:acetyl/propionyl/methylcrotonyl-CoA carboxylase subunit alpha n=1 Tax=Inquilinus sp. CAU 1745 TaxID=3140369 RepID=UPI00325C03FE
MFSKILIANRGEIACRVIRTARRLGIRTVAVHSDADAAALHVAMADEAYAIGPAPAAESYLRGDLVLEAAKRAGAEAIHPGYGFLSENASFADACAEADIVFIGPPPDAIRAMGGKSEAKALMERAGVPLVPGYHGDDSSASLLAKEAERIGFPVLIKASAGGGGKGMRVVEDSGAFQSALDGARREAKAAFGDERVLIEKYLARPRHVEVQIFADRSGEAVYLFERDCSIQRRHQKVIEEAPAPDLPADLRAAMGEAAVAAAKAIGYEGAGTVEFLLDEDRRFYFMEMNTRLQVEHPVTEFITGLDLVEWQLIVAAGGNLPLRQEELSIDGHAIEARIYAEDADRGFLPSTGTLRRLDFPQAGPHVRIDAGVRAGDTISVNYDPMIAKLIVWDRDRAAAVRRLEAALTEVRVAGVASNVDFLRRIATHPAFRGADLDTRFIDRHGDGLKPSRSGADDAVLATAALFVLLDRKSAAEKASRRSADPWSPWNRADGWRLNDEGRADITLRDEDGRHVVPVRYRRDGGYRLSLPRGEMPVEGALESDGALTAVLDGVRKRVVVDRSGDMLTLFMEGGACVLHLVDAVQAADREGGEGRLAAPMPGKIVAVLVAEGQAVRKGEALVVLEAMKMEHTVAAPADGTVARLPFGVGDQVEEGADLVGFEASEGGEA